jgi:hypothetical protein
MMGPAVKPDAQMTAALTGSCEQEEIARAGVRYDPTALLTVAWTAAWAATGATAAEATPSVPAKPAITTVTIERIGLMVRDLLAVIGGRGRMCPHPGVTRCVSDS